MFSDFSIPRLLGSSNDFGNETGVDIKLLYVSSRFLLFIKALCLSNNRLHNEIYDFKFFLNILTI